MKIQCSTKFDITATGVTGHYRSSRVPFQDHAGKKIQNETDWNRSRNQQRNWETLTQLISLRTQIFNVTDPELSNDTVWTFSFEVDAENLFLLDNDDMGILKLDCQGVPMLIGLNESQQAGTVLIPDQNIWFINTSEE